MKKLLCAAVSVGAVIAMRPAQAIEYGFYTASGGGFCDGIKYIPGKLGAAGVHVYDQVYCKYPDAYLGGYRGTIPALGTGQWYTFPVQNAQGDAVTSSYVPVFYINQAKLEWVVAVESTDYHMPFTVINNGILIKGKPRAVKGGKHQTGSALQASLIKAGIIRK